MRLVVLGLSLSSSWGNGHATTFRALLKAFAARGHDILFLERETPWYAARRDLADPDYCRLVFYADLAGLEAWAAEVAAADAVIVGSYVPQGVAAGDWVLRHARGLVAFYDIDTPVTLAKLDRGDEEYLSPGLIARYGLYLSFTGGPTLARLMRRYGSPMARALYCSVDPDACRPIAGAERRWDLSYLGTYSADRQPTLDRLLLQPARLRPALRFAVAGPQYPADIDWPSNVERLDHVAPSDHAAFYAASRYTLNVTRADMIAAGHSPSVRLFEAAACGIPILSDTWPGLDEVLTPGLEILTPVDGEAVAAILDRTDEAARAAIGNAARARVLARHTAAHRALELERHLGAAAGEAARAGSSLRPPSRP